MKILIATESYYPNISGVAVFSHNLARKMAENGHVVHVVAPSPKLNPYTEEIEGVFVHRLASKINPFRKGYYISKSPFFKIRELMEEIRPDIIHLQDPAAISLATLMRARKMKIPVVVTNHFALDYVTSYLPLLRPIHPLIRFFLGTYLGWLYNRADVLTCPSQKIAEYFISRRLKSQPIVISNGVDLGRFMPEYGDRKSILSRWKIDQSKPIILYVGRLDVDKKVSLLVQAMSTILQKTAAHLILVGEGKERENLQKIAKELGMAKSVTFTGLIANGDLVLPKIYQDATLFVNPCPIEAQGISVLEAMASGLAVVAANSGALPEVIKSGQNGYLFEPNNQEDLAQKISSILNEPQKIKKMGQKSLEIIESHKVENTFSKFETIYKSLINNK